MTVTLPFWVVGLLSFASLMALVHFFTIGK